ncbi:VCBS repeat-containing protein [bacterium]|nr:VCBS repeat-containing protein [bacterium]
MNRLLLSILITVLTVSTISANDIGFKDFEIYKSIEDAHTLTVKDMNGDSLPDFLYVDNKSAQISILYQLSKKDEERYKKEIRENLKEENINQLSFNTKFKNIPFITERTVLSIAIGDFSNDKKNDIAFLSSTGEVIIAHQDKPYSFEKKQIFQVNEPHQSLYSLAASDMNGDKLDDLVVLTKKDILILYQNKKGELSEPISFSYSVKSPLGIECADYNGDGKDDILLVTTGGSNQLHVRFQEDSGEMGPEYSVNYPNFHFLTSKDIFPKIKGDEILSSRANAKIVFIDHIVEASQTDTPSPAIYSLPTDAKSYKKTVWIGDLNGDKKNDILVSDSEYPSSILFTANKESLGQYKLYPSFKGISKIKSTKDKIFLYSSEEKSIGWLDKNRVEKTFPQLLPINKSIEGFDIIDDKIFILAKNDESYELIEGSFDSKNSFKEISTTKIEEFNNTPYEIMIDDFNSDGKYDLLLFISYEPAQFFFQTEDKKLKPFAIKSQTVQTLFKNITSDKISYFSVNGDKEKHFFLSLKNIIREISFENGDFQIKNQWNGTTTQSDLTNVIISTFNGKTKLASFDKTTKSFIEFDYNNNKNIETTAINLSEVLQIESQDLNRDKKTEIIFISSDSVAVLDSKNRGYSLKNILTYTLPNPKSISSIVGVATFNKLKVVSIDGARNFVEFYNLTEKDLSFAIRFKIFETKSYRGDDALASEEPREMQIFDMDKDGKTDILLLVHNKILIYYQE